MVTHAGRVVVPLMAVLSSLWWSGARGQTAVDSGMDSTLRDIVVRVHNSYRTMARASNMLAVRWSESLEREAASWVDRCEFRHQDDPPWGENIYRSEFDRQVNQIVYTGLNSWNLERSFFSISGNSCCDAIFNTTLCCNYQQMVWSRTRNVGCALKKCPLLKATDKTFNNAWFFACYYSPRGNVAGLKPYETGTTCSQCPDTYDQCDKNLCYPSLFCKGDL